MILSISAGQLIISGLLLGLGLTMDAAAVSMANGLEEPHMSTRKHIFIAFMYAFFQAFMPFIGYLFGSTIYKNVPQIEQYHLIPIIALVILGFLGTKMIIDAIKESKNEEEEEKEIIGKKLTFKLIFIQAIATSIDALSTGLTFADYSMSEALIVILLISIVTFIVSYVSVIIGKKFGLKLGNKAMIVGGVILILIGLEIFITGLI